MLSQSPTFALALAPTLTLVLALALQPRPLPHLCFTPLHRRPFVCRHPHPSLELEPPPYHPYLHLAGHSGGDSRKGKGGLWRDAPLQARVPGHRRREQRAVNATGLAVLVGQGLRHMRGDDVDQCARPACRHSAPPDTRLWPYGESRQLSPSRVACPHRTRCTPLRCALRCTTSERREPDH